MTMTAQSRRAFSLIELLVVIAIIGIVAALTLSGIQAAREAARRAQCLSNLRQFGIAIHNYESSYKMFPQGMGGVHSESLHVQLLPFAEQTALYNAINHSIFVHSNENTTALRTAIGLLHCPSDPESITETTNYAGCIGDGLRPCGALCGEVRAADVTDGLAGTAGMAEFLVGKPGVNERRRTYYVPDDLHDGPAATAEAFAIRCRALDRESPAYDNDLGMLKGRYWIVAKQIFTLYDHFLPVNQPSCRNTYASTEALLATTAGSNHPGGANALFMDGHAHFVRETIEMSVWRALGTRAAGEVVSADAY